MKYKNVILFIVGIAAILFLVIYVYLVSNKDWFFDLSEKGTIGDAIGGITAPVIGMLGAFLVYISFRSQVNANQLLINQNEFKLYLELINDLKQDILRLHDRKSWNISTIKTPYLIEIRKSGRVSAVFKRQLIFILKNFVFIRERVEKTTLIDLSEKLALKNLLENLYVSYMEVYCKAYEKSIIISPIAPLHTELKNLAFKMIELNSKKQGEILGEDD